jgi:hypothetical protein
MADRSSSSLSAAHDVELLSGLIAVLGPSPLMYVGDSGIWSYPGEEAVKLAIADVVDEQKSLLGRAEGLLADFETPAPQYGFPLSLTAWHDLDLQHLLPRLLQDLEQRSAKLNRMVDAPVRPLASRTVDDLLQESLSCVGEHIDALRQLLPPAAIATAPTMS